MKAFYFADYRLLLDDSLADGVDSISGRKFTEPMKYTDTFTLRVGADDEFDGIYREVQKEPVVYENRNYRIRRTSGGRVFEVLEKPTTALTLLVCSDDCSEITAFMRKKTFYNPVEKKDDVQRFPIYLGLKVACETAMTFHNGIAVHASLIEKNGAGILFLGPSGMGKSTQAKLWQKVYDADFIIGDRPTLRLIDGLWFGNGMPWDGKDRILRQKKVRLTAAVSLEQSDVNEIVRLDRQGAMEVLLKQSAIPMWDQKATDAVVRSLGDISEKIPFYHLKNRADRECAEITYKAVMGEEL